jgi:hypothetical protein
MEKIGRRLFQLLPGHGRAPARIPEGQGGKAEKITQKV